MIGNDVLLKCNIPSFVGDFLRVNAWVSSDGDQIFSNHNSLGNEEFWCF